MNYALIENGVVTNIIWLYSGNAGDFPSAVPCGDLPVAIGDAYVDGKFYRDGELLKSQMDVAIEDMEDMHAALTELGVTIDG